MKLTAIHIPSSGFIAHCFIALCLARLILSLSSVALGQENSACAITASVDRDEVVIGELVRYELTVEYPASFEAPEVGIGVRLGDFEALDHQAGDVRTLADGRRAQTHLYDLAAFDTGAFEIPSLTIEARSIDGATSAVLSTPPIAVTVVDAPEAKDATELLDFKPPSDMAPDHTLRNWLLAGGAGLISLLAGLIWWMRRRSRRRESTPKAAPPLPEDEVALAELRRLSERLPETLEEAMVFYIELSGVARVFLGRRFGFDAMDLTTSETLARLEEPIRAREPREEIGEFLDGCDLVKFAKYPATKDQALAAIEQARAMVAAHRRSVA